MNKGFTLKSIPELFAYLDSKRKWQDYYFKIKNDFEILASDGQNSDNMHKNRYCNVWPWNKNRVILQQEDYINASLVATPIIGLKYICTQEPLTGCESTKDDFWHMIWQNDSSVIIMLNDPSENNSYHHKEYYPYYPTGSHEFTEYSSSIGLKVALLAREEHDSYIISKLDLSFNDKSREITHLQFRGWKDYAIPSSAQEFYTFMLVARSHYEPKDSPPVIHCSAGVGRTGTFVLADVILKIIAEKKTLHIDVESLLTKLREERMWLVQTPEQLRFCFQTILEGIKEIDNLLEADV